MKIKCLAVSIVLLCSLLGTAQKYDRLTAKFTVAEKTRSMNDSVSNSLLVGHIDYTLSANTLKYDLTFPERGQWILQDSTILVSKADTSYAVVSTNELNAQSIFQNFLNPQNDDLGLAEMGFLQDLVERTDDGILIEWAPPRGFDAFLDSVMTRYVDGELASVIFFDIDGVVINATYFSDYWYFDGLAVPRLIKSKFASSKAEKFKTLTLQDVSVH